MLDLILNHLSEAERASVLQKLFTSKTFEGFLAECSSFITAQPARLVADLSRLRLEANKRFESIHKLSSHAKRTRSKSLQEYIESVAVLKNRFKETPSNNLWRILEKHVEHAIGLINELRNGEYAEEIAVVAKEALQEDLAKDAEDLLKQIGKGAPSKNDEVSEEDVKEHEKFVRSLEKDFDITVHHFEPVNEGIFVYIDEENNDELLRQLQTLEDRLDKLNAKHGYLLVRKGTTDDILWGSYPNGMAKWMFIRCKPDSEEWDDKDDLESLEGEVVSDAEKMKPQGVDKSMQSKDQDKFESTLESKIFSFAGKPDTEV